MIHEVVMPGVGHYSEHAVKILTWQVGEGEHLERGQEILEVETEKSVVVIEAFRAGYLRKILALEGEEVLIGGILALISDAPTEPIPSRYLTGKGKITPPAHEPAAGPAPATTSAQSSPSGPVPSAVQALPAARLLADELGVDLARIRGTGPSGAITEADVRSAAGSTMDET